MLKSISIGVAAILCIVSSFTLAQPASKWAEDFPSLAVPESLGINIHFTDPKPGEMEMLAGAGFRFVRMDFHWAGIERKKGQYDFSAFDRLVDAAEKHHVRCLFILDYANPLYDQGRSPASEEARAAFAKWAAAGVRHFKGRHILWEMWNEPNIGFWKPVPNTEDYIKLAIATGKAIRDAEPGETYFGPATSTIDLPFLEACFKAGLLEYWSAVSVHPYRQSNPETAADEYRRLRLLIARYAPTGKNIPILSGEWGYSSVWKNFDDDRQGKYLPRQWLTNLSNDVPVSIWYDWHDDGADPKDPEHHFGTTLHPRHADRPTIYDPKPAYLAAKALTTTLGGLQFNKRLWTGKDDEYVLLFSRGAQQEQVKLAVWTTAAEPRTITIPASAGKFAVTDHLGKTLEPVAADAKGITVTLGDNVKYLAPQEMNDALRVAAAWDRAPLEKLVKGPQRVDISLGLQNPLGHELRLANGASLPAAPAAGAGTGAVVTVGRNATPIPVTLDLQLQGLAPWSQRTQAVAINPLSMTVLPFADDTLPVRIDNPSGEPLSGTLALTDPPAYKNRGISATVEIKAGQKETIVVLKLPEAQKELASLGLALNDANHETLIALAPATYRPIDIFDKPAAVADIRIHADGSPKVASEQSLTAAAPSGDLPPACAGAVKLSYKIAAGWKFLCLAPATEPGRQIAGRPATFGLWVFGNGANTMPRLRFRDSTGQTFQTGSDSITWKGWRFITFPLNASRGPHWGGANDGKIHYPIKWEAIFLLDRSADHPAQGEIYLGRGILAE